MAEFFNVLPPDEARALLTTHIQPIKEVESIHALDAIGRITGADIYAPQSLPAFRRSSMDGYAVRARDTHGATDTLPAFLLVIGEIRMGQAAEVILGAGEAALVHTGGMLPDTADAVVQIEHTQTITSIIDAGFPYEIEVFRSVAPGQNVIQIGEDVDLGSLVIPAGSLLRPQEIGGLMALGITTITVVRRPRVSILATGDEVVPPATLPDPGKIRDINSYTVAGQVIKAGGIPDIIGIIPDNLEALYEAAVRALAMGDMLVVSAGSSVSARDITVEVINLLGDPGVLLHGVATRPGKPTIVGASGGKPVLGLPGNPVSAMVQFDMFGVPALYDLQGVIAHPQRSHIWARLTLNLPSESGREDYVPGRLRQTEAGLLVAPIFGKSNLIFTLIQADGLIKVPLNKGGLAAGEFVEVYLF